MAIRQAEGTPHFKKEVLTSFVVLFTLLKSGNPLAHRVSKPMRMTLYNEERARDVFSWPFRSEELPCGYIYILRFLADYSSLTP